MGVVVGTTGGAAGGTTDPRSKIVTRDTGSDSSNGSGSPLVVRGLLSVTKNVSCPSTSISFSTLTGIVAVVSPAANDSVPVVDV